MVQYAEVDYDAGAVTEEEILRAIHHLGYEPHLKKTAEPSGAARFSWSLWGMVLSGMLTALGAAFQWYGMPEMGVRWVYFAAVLCGGSLFARKAAAAIRHGVLDMHVLMTVAICGAMAIGEWLEGASVAFLFALANHIEAQSMGRARHAIRSAMTLMPASALVLEEGAESLRPVDRVRVGERIVVKPGEQIPLDGTVVEGVSSVNEAPISGESVPVDKQVDDTVFAGTINGEGALTIRVAASSGNTALARIVRLIEEAQRQRAQVQRLVDRFARIYTPVVVALAVLIALVPPALFDLPFTAWLYRALVLLVIACPCALVISTPVVIVSGLTAAARHGVLIKGGLYLEQLGGVTALAFDKTGTLTAGHPVVTGVQPVDGLSEQAVIALAASLESRSEHPIARAIAAFARDKHIPPRAVRQFSALPGCGAQAQIDGQTYYIGNARLFSRLGMLTPDVEDRIRTHQDRGDTPVLVGSATAMLGLITLQDRPRPESARTLQALRQAGVTSLVMLTGDHTAAARSLAEELGMDAWEAELLPEEKVTAVQRLADRHQRVGMVGDGFNDAPALASATVGIAMGSIGTSTTLETADVVLMQDDLRMLPAAIGLGRRALAVIRSNIAIALGFKAVFLLLAATGVATLWMAIVADMGASLLVIGNGLRLLNHRMT
jgi:Cd2+/Zn2+-exporting ATPase